MIRWQNGASISVFNLHEAFGSVVHAIGASQPEWVVFQEMRPFGMNRVYAFRPTELRAAAAILGDHRPVTAAIGAPLEGRPALRYDFAGEPLGGFWDANRAVQLDPSGEVQTVGEVVTGGEELFRGVTGIGGSTEAEPRDIGDPDAAITVEPVDCVLSAQAGSVLPVADVQPVDVRLELAEGAHPLAQHVPAALAADVDVTAILFAEPQGRVERLEPSILTLKPPTAGTPTHDAFVVRGVIPGPVKLTVAFRQGGSPLGSVSFECEVRAGAANETQAASASSTADPRDPLEDSGLILIVEEHLSRDEVRYRYRVHSAAFGLNYEVFDSRPFRNAQGQATAPLAYVQDVYRRLETRALKTIGDVKLFERELRSLGVDLCTQLLPADLVEVLWNHRDQIKLVEVNAGEPYVPWELVRLRHPSTRQVDDRYLASYGLVRTFAGRMGPSCSAATPGTCWSATTRTGRALRSGPSGRGCWRPSRSED